MIFRLSKDIDKDWLIAREMLYPAFCGIFQVDDIDDYYESLKQGIAQLWIAEDDKQYGAVLTLIDQGKQGKVLQVRYLGGSKLRKWALLMENMLTSFAQDNHCVHIEGWTRKGFSRLIKTFKPQGLELFIKVV